MKSSLLVLTLLFGLSVPVVAAEIPSPAPSSLSTPGNPSGDCAPRGHDDLFAPQPASGFSSQCGSCSAYPCEGAAVNSPCYTWQGGWAWCIPQYFTYCSEGPQDDTNWSCQCASLYV